MKKEILNDTEITPDLDKLKTLLVKVKELAERGDSGERDVAKTKLEKLLKKYGLKLKDVELQNKNKRIFRIVNKEDCVNIISQTIWDVAPKVDIKQSTRKLEVYCSLTSEEYIEVCEKFNYYWNLWCKEKKQFLTAFIIKNKLGTEGQSSKGEKLDEETIAGIRKKMNGVAKGNYVNKKSKLIC